MYMTVIQTFLHTIWMSLLTLGLLKTIIAVVLIALLSRAQHLLGVLGAILFIAYLAQWI